MGELTGLELLGLYETGSRTTQEIALKCWEILQDIDETGVYSGSIWQTYPELKNRDNSEHPEEIDETLDGDFWDSLIYDLEQEINECLSKDYPEVTGYFGFSGEQGTFGFQPNEDEEEVEGDQENE